METSNKYEAKVKKSDHSLDVKILAFKNKVSVFEGVPQSRVGVDLERRGDDEFLIACVKPVELNDAQVQLKNSHMVGETTVTIKPEAPKVEAPTAPEPTSDKDFSNMKMQQLRQEMEELPEEWRMQSTKADDLKARLNQYYGKTEGGE